MKTPKDFCTYPWGSVLESSECEFIALNVMRILNRTQGIFRPLNFEEYKFERLLDGKFSESEKYYFDKIISYCKSEDTAKLFSPEWNKQH